MIRLRNETVWRRVDVREKFSDKVDRKVLNWFGYVEYMSGKRVTRVCNSVVWWMEGQ